MVNEVVLCLLEAVGILNLSLISDSSKTHLRVVFFPAFKAQYVCLVYWRTCRKIQAKLIASATGDKYLMFEATATERALHDEDDSGLNWPPKGTGWFAPQRRESHDARRTCTCTLILNCAGSFATLDSNRGMRDQGPWPQRPFSIEETYRLFRGVHEQFQQFVRLGILQNL